MEFYIQSHQFYCGIDLHARSLFICILDQNDEICVHKNIKASPTALFKIVKPYRDNMVVAVECMFSVLSPDSPYLLHPCSRPGTGSPIGVKTKV